MGRPVRGRRNGRTPTSSKHRQQGRTTARKLHSQTRQTTSCHHDERSACGGIGAFSGFGHFTSSSHRNPEVKRYIERNNSLLYSVPYQHYTNAIETFFSVMKSHIQKEELIGRAALLRSIPKALERDFASAVPQLYQRRIRAGRCREVRAWHFHSSQNTKKLHLRRSAFMIFKGVNTGLTDGYNCFKILPGNAVLA